MVRYLIRASSDAGPIEFQERMTIGAALAKAKELREAHFDQITLINEATGLKIELDALMLEQRDLA